MTYQGSTCGDVGAAVCCPLCVQCQVGVEILYCTVLYYTVLQVGVEIQDKQPAA